MWTPFPPKRFVYPASGTVQPCQIQSSLTIMVDIKPLDWKWKPRSVLWPQGQGGHPEGHPESQGTHTCEFDASELFKPIEQVPGGMALEIHISSSHDQHHLPGHPVLLVQGMLLIQNQLIVG
jgi:hypothetical protein